MRFIRLASFALFFALFGELSSYGQIDQELISVEWKKLEKRVRKIAKKSASSLIVLLIKEFLFWRYFCKNHYICKRILRHKNENE